MAMSSLLIFPIIGIILIAVIAVIITRIAGRKEGSQNASFYVPSNNYGAAYPTSDAMQQSQMPQQQAAVNVQPDTPSPEQSTEAGGFTPPPQM